MKFFLKYCLIILFAFSVENILAGNISTSISEYHFALDSIPPQKTPQSNKDNNNKGKVTPPKGQGKSQGKAKVKVVPAAKNKPTPVRVGQPVKAKPVKVVKPKVGKGIK